MLKNCKGDKKEKEKSFTVHLHHTCYDMLKLEAFQDRMTIEEYAVRAIMDYIERNKI